MIRARASSGIAIVNGERTSPQKCRSKFPHAAGFGDRVLAGAASLGLNGRPRWVSGPGSRGAMMALARMYSGTSSTRLAQSRPHRPSARARPMPFSPRSSGSSSVAGEALLLRPSRSTRSPPHQLRGARLPDGRSARRLTPRIATTSVDANLTTPT